MVVIKDAMGEPITLTLKTGDILTIPVRGEKRVNDSAITDEILKARDNGLILIIKEQKTVKAKTTNKNGGIENE